VMRLLISGHNLDRIARHPAHLRSADTVNVLYHACQEEMRAEKSSGFFLQNTV
jgi:hypothetical protein